MKGIILAGGSGTRLHPITRVVSKQPRFPDLRAIIESAWKWHVNHPKGSEDQG